MNARADYEQLADDQERQERTLQALMDIASVGLRQQADFLAAECGVWREWKQEISANG